MDDMVNTKIEPTVVLNGWWSFLLKTWLVAFPIVVSAIIGNFAWLNYEVISSKASIRELNQFTVQQLVVNSKLATNDEAMLKSQVDILVSLGKISTELELQRKK